MPGPKPPNHRNETPKALTSTERTILRALRKGETLREIAESLGRSELTVRTHIRNARAKLEVRGTAELRLRLTAGEMDGAIDGPIPPGG